MKLLSARDGHEAQNARQLVRRPGALQARPVSRNESQPDPSPLSQSASPEFRKAIKYDAKLRFAVCGPAGSGKTYTLLRLAMELGGPVALVDTERGSASKYADLFEFDV